LFSYYHNETHFTHFKYNDGDHFVVKKPKNNEGFVQIATKDLKYLMEAKPTDMKISLYHYEGENQLWQIDCV
jgi:hypothetical protein